VNSKFKTNPKFGFWHGKNSQARRKNLEKFVEVGNLIWRNFCY
jgi:hypothetical protein